MSTAIYRAEDPTLKTIEFGAVYQICAPRTGEPWALYKISEDCGISSVDMLDVPDGWDDSHEYPRSYPHIWSRLDRLAMDAFRAITLVEVAFVPVVDEDTTTDSYALLHRFIWPF
jgi:hypothetical protein